MVVDVSDGRLGTDGNLLGGWLPIGATVASPTITARVIAARSSSDNVVIRVVDTTGVPTGSLVPLNVGANRQCHPTVVAGNNHYLLLWGDRRMGTHAAYAQRYSASGVALDAVPFVVANGAVRSLAGAFDGASYLVAAAAGGQLRAIRISSAGAPRRRGGRRALAPEEPRPCGGELERRDVRGVRFGTGFNDDIFVH